MSLYPKFRDVHLYVGLALMIPVMIIAATGIGLNHERALGLKPQYEKKKEKPNRQREKEGKVATTEAGRPAIQPVSHVKEVVAPLALRARSGLMNDYSAAMDGAMLAARDAWGDAPLEHIQLRDEPGYGLVIKMKVPGHSGLTPEEIVYSVAAQEVVERKGEKGEGYPLHKIIHDLHTGKIFSKDYGVLWSDISAGSILLLSMTGVVLWVIPMVKKRQSKLKKQAAAGRSTADALAQARKPKLKAKTVPETADTSETVST